MSDYHKVLRGLVKDSDIDSAIGLMKSREIRKNSLSPLNGYNSLGNPESKSNQDSKSLYVISAFAIFAFVGYTLYKSR